MSTIVKIVTCFALAALAAISLFSKKKFWEKAANIMIALAGVVITIISPSVTNTITAQTVIIYQNGEVVEAPIDNGFTSVTLQDCNLNNDQGNWYPAVVANEGDTIRFKVIYTNKSDDNQNDVLVFIKWSDALEYIPGSTMLYNSNYKEGLKLSSDGLADDTGINIGSYLAGASAVVTYEARVKDGLGIGVNYLRNWAQIYVNDMTPDLEKDFVQDFADVIVSK